MSISSLGSSSIENRVVLTGANGFIGSNLKSYLNQRGLDVIACPVDLTAGQEAFESFLKGVDSSGGAFTLIHLAGLSHVPTCELDPDLTVRINVQGTQNLANALAKVSPSSRFVFASTAQVYRPNGPEDELGIAWTEDRAIEPLNRYSSSKWEAEKLLQRISKEFGLETVVLRLFNHTHCTQSPQFFLPAIYQQLVLAANGQGPLVIETGNLDLYRDIGSLQDLLRAFGLLIGSKGLFPRYSVFNLSSGSPKHLMQLAIEMARRVGVEVEFRVLDRLLRKNDPKYVLGSHEKLSKVLGWHPVAVQEESLIAKFLEPLR